MKAIRIFLLVIIVMNLAFMAEFADADDEVDSWRSIYTRAKTTAQRREVILGLIEENNKELIPIFIEAFEQIVEERVSLSSDEKASREDLMLLIIRELGNLRAEKAAALLYRITRDTDSANIEMESIIALGKVGDSSYASKVAEILDELNTSRGHKPQDEDRIAYGCIIALESFEDPVGYRPIFYALDAGYSQYIVENAQRALQKLVVDPTQYLERGNSGGGGSQGEVAGA